MCRPCTQGRPKENLPSLVSQSVINSDVSESLCLYVYAIVSFKNAGCNSVNEFNDPPMSQDPLIELLSLGVTWLLYKMESWTVCFGCVVEARFLKKIRLWL